MMEQKYFLCYDVQVAGQASVTRQGRSETIFPYDKDFSLVVCDNLCDIHGQGTHWIEDETGTVITREE